MKSKIKKIKCDITMSHKYETIVRYYGRGVELVKCDICGKKKEIKMEHFTNNNNGLTGKV